jgi:hypothetical protein
MNTSHLHGRALPQRFRRHSQLRSAKGACASFTIRYRNCKDRYIAGTARNEADLLSLLQLIRPRNSGACEIQAASTVTGSA